MLGPGKWSPIVPTLEAARDPVAQAALRAASAARRPIVGTGPMSSSTRFGSLAERGVERVYVWFCDFAPPETLAAFGETVIGQLGRTP